MNIEAIIASLFGGDPRQNPNFQDKTAEKGKAVQAGMHDMVRRHVAESELRSGDAAAMGYHPNDVEEWLDNTDPKREPFNPIAELEAYKAEGGVTAPEEPKDWGSVQGITDQLFGPVGTSVADMTGVGAPLPPPRPSTGPSQGVPRIPAELFNDDAHPPGDGRSLEQLFGEAQGDLPPSDPDKALEWLMSQNPENRRGAPLPNQDVQPMGRAHESWINRGEKKNDAKVMQEPATKWPKSATSSDPDSPIAQYFSLAAQAAMGDPTAALKLQALQGTGPVR